MSFRKLMTAFALTASIGLLSACDSSEERAEKHYQAGLEYLEAGDVDRALVELRNVFQLNSRHKDARRVYAEAEMGRGRLREAFAQYLRLLEQFPDDQNAKVALAKLAAEAGDWVTAANYSEQALISAPDDLEMQAIRLSAVYGTATVEDDVTSLVSAARGVRELRDQLPDNLLLRRVVIDDDIRAQRYQSALDELEAAIAIAPNDRTLFAQSLSVHAALGDDAAVEAGLRDMVDRFPDAPEMGQALVRWYISRNEIEKAEDHLRAQINADASDHTPVLELVRFLAEFKGSEAAVAELERTIAANPNAAVYRAARAGFIFDLGNRDEAIAQMQAILDEAGTSEETRRTKVGLARMLSVTGNSVGARALIEEVLAEDGGDGDALKLKASWLILDDQVGEAISLLRRAIDYNPGDATILTLMAQAYERDGNRDLMRESLSRAVVASNRAPAESLRYAQLLASEDKLISAEGILIDALRIAPGNTTLLAPLGQIYLQVQDWPRANDVADELDSLGDPDSITTAQALRAAIFAGQQQSDEAVGYLQGLVDQGNAGLGVKVAILRAHINNGRIEQALTYSSNLLSEDPENPELRFIDASVRALIGQTDAAEAAYRELAAEDGTRLPVWMALMRLLLSDPARYDEANALIDTALTALPDSGELKWAKAGFLERNGDIEGAIEVYEGLYKENSGNPVVANNLASLLSNNRTDAESLARAEVIARRLRGSALAPYRDTYGWIAYLRGNYNDALEHLVTAAEVLNTDPIVQYHLAMTYLALDRKSDALNQFHIAISVAPERSTHPNIIAAHEAIAKLEAEGVTIGN